MPDTIHIGKLVLSGPLLTALIAALAGYGALRLWAARDRGSRSGPWGDLTAGAALTAVVVWKFGVLFREPSLLWEEPRLLLVIVGSGAEAAAGLAAAGLYWIWQARRKGVGLLQALDALAVAAAGGLLVWNALSAFEYRWGYAAVCAALLAALIGKRAPEAAQPARGAAGEAGGADEREAAGGGGAAGTAAAGMAALKRGNDAGCAAVLAGYVLGAGCLAVSLFAAQPPWVRPPMLAGLTSTQLLFIAAGLAAAALDAYKGKAG